MHLHHEDIAPIAGFGTTDRLAHKIPADGGGTTVPKTTTTTPAATPAKPPLADVIKAAAADGKVTTTPKVDEKKTVFDKANPTARDEIWKLEQVAKANAQKEADDKSYTYDDHGQTVHGDGDFNNQDRVNRMKSEHGTSGERNGVFNKFADKDGNVVTMTPDQAKAQGLKPLTPEQVAKDLASNPSDTKNKHGNVDDWDAALALKKQELANLKTKGDVQPGDVKKLNDDIYQIESNKSAAGEAERHISNEVKDRLQYVGTLELDKQGNLNELDALKKDKTGARETQIQTAYDKNKGNIYEVTDPKKLLTLSDDDYNNLKGKDTNKNGVATEFFATVDGLRNDNKADADRIKTLEDRNGQIDKDIKDNTDKINDYRSVLSKSTNQAITDETGAEFGDTKVTKGSAADKYNNPAGDAPAGDAPAGNTSGPDSHSVDPKTGVVTDTGKDGTTTVSDPTNGTKVVTKPDGTKTTTEPNGSSTEVDSQGNTTHTDQNGRVTKTDKDGKPIDGTDGGGTFDPTKKYDGVTKEGYYYWTSPDNKWHPTAKDTSGAKYLVQDGDSWKEGSPPAGGNGGTDPGSGTGTGTGTGTDPGTSTNTGDNPTAGGEKGGSTKPKVTADDIVKKHDGLSSTYAVQGGDDLSKIAQHYNDAYGTKLTYDDLYAANKEIIDKTAASMGVQANEGYMNYIYSSENALVIPGIDQAINGELQTANQDPAVAAPGAQ